MSTMLGIIGGGQLGSYFVLAAQKMGYQTAVLDPDPGAPAATFRLLFTRYGTSPA